MEDNSVAPAVAHHELAATADLGDEREGLAATADQDPDIDSGKVSDDDSEDDCCWPGSSEGWAEIYRGALAISKPSRSPAEKPRVATLFSGSEAPIAALDQLMPDGYRHVLSREVSDASRQFIQANFEPEHLFSDIDDYNKPFAACCICGGPCDGFHQKVDFVMAGFPCTPFSAMSPKRLKEGYDLLDHPDAGVFLSLRKYMEYCEAKPDAG